MKENKVLRHCLKRKVRITEGLIVLFLITGSVSYGINISSNYDHKENNAIINNNSGIATDIDNWIDSDNVVLSNSGIFSTFFKGLQNVIGYDIREKGNGLNIKERLENTTIKNKGIIKGNATSDTIDSKKMYAIGNGISAFGEYKVANIQEITNEGNISGSGNLENQKQNNNHFSGVGNGVAVLNNYKTNGGVGVVNNSGVMVGDLKSVGAKNQENKTSVAIQVYSSGNGINNEYLLTGSGTTTDTVTNDGLILGKGYLEAGNTLNTTATGIGYVETVTTANGINNYAAKGNSVVNKMTNTGIIKGELSQKGGNITGANSILAEVSSLKGGNGIAIASGYDNENKLGELENSGIIEGSVTLLGGTNSRPLNTNSTNYMYAHGEGSGNGIVITNDGFKNKVEILNNEGVVSGFIYAEAGKNELGKSYESIEFSGNGIAIKGDISGKIENKGVIKGVQSAIAAKSIATILNEGVLAGREIFSSGIELIKNNSTLNDKKLNAINPTNHINSGIEIKLKTIMDSEKSTGKVEIDSNGNPVVEYIKNGTAGLAKDGKTIINAQRYDEKGKKTEEATLARDSYIVSEGNYDNNILNGAGINKGTLVVDKNTEIKNSIINGYNTAVYLEGDNNLIATNTIFNGGGLKNNISVIKGIDGSSNIEILENSIINGKVELGDGQDTLLISGSTKVNGILDGGNGEDLLTLGDSNKELKIYHDIINFEKINSNGNITLYENAKIKNEIGKETDINIENGYLTLRVDPTIKEGEKISGHALYDHKGKIESNKGKLKIALNGLDKGAIIALNGTTITLKNNNLGDSSLLDEVITTNSLVLDGRLTTDKKDILIDVKNSLVDLLPPTIKPEKEWTLVSKHNVTKEKLEELHSSGVELVGKDGKIYAVDKANKNAYELNQLPEKEWTLVSKHNVTKEKLEELHSSGVELVGKDGKVYAVDKANKNAYELNQLPEKEWTLVSKHNVTKEKLEELHNSGVELVGKDGKVYAVDKANKNAYELNQITNRNDLSDFYNSNLYKKLDKVYQSVISAEEIGKLANTTLLEDKTYNESLGELLTLLDQIYANNPYAYTLKSSRDSLKLFEDNLSYLTIKPKKDEMIVQGKAIYTGVKNDSNASGKNYYGFDTGHRNYKTTTNTVGGLATFEYGLSDKTSVGFVLGGNNQNINFKGSSKIKGNSLYLGTFAKTDVDNFKFMSGVGYQYTSADADRKISNRYDSFSTGDKYDINSLNVFAEAKYVYNAEHDWTVEPKLRLSYYYIEQERVNEGYTPGQISMRADKADSNTADVEIGVDFIKSLYLAKGKLKNILSLGVINTIGDKSKELNGYILGKEKDGNKFNIQGVELPKTSGKVSYSLELEQTNGMIYTAGVSLEFAKDYNRNVNATVGIGYKF